MKEILTAEEGTEATKQRQIYIAKIGKRFSFQDLKSKLDGLVSVINEEVDNEATIKSMLREIVYGLEILAQKEDKI